MTAVVEWITDDKWREELRGSRLFVQWCIKGMALIDDQHARDVLDQRGGLLSNWWRAVGTISPQERRDRLTSPNLDRHVNHFLAVDPATNRPFSEQTPFISLSAGTVERDAVARTNIAHTARSTAIRFGTSGGRSTTAYLYVCWVLLAPRIAVEIEGVAEEVRDLNTYRRYSDYQTEGEIAAKVSLPDNQIRSCERWDLDTRRGLYTLKWVYSNPRFTPPDLLSNLREVL